MQFRFPGGRGPGLNPTNTGPRAARPKPSSGSKVDRKNSFPPEEEVTSQSRRVKVDKYAAQRVLSDFVAAWLALATGLIRGCRSVQTFLLGHPKASF